MKRFINQMNSGGNNQQHSCHVTPGFFGVPFIHNNDALGSITQPHTDQDWEASFAICWNAIKCDGEIYQNWLISSGRPRIIILRVCMGRA